MQILDNLIIITIHVLCFIAGMTLANKYHAKAESEKKDALERQFLRLKARADADDPCRPYSAPAKWINPTQPLAPFNQGDPDGDKPQPITPQFMEHLRENKQASTKFRKSDLRK